MFTPLTTPVPVRTVKAVSANRLFALLAAAKGRIDRIGLPTRLDRMSDRQLKDVGLDRNDSDWLRGRGSSEDVAIRLAIKAGARAGNW